jgi:hypothetical protein
MAISQNTLFDYQLISMTNIFFFVFIGMAQAHIAFSE